MGCPGVQCKDFMALSIFLSQVWGMHIKSIEKVHIEERRSP